MHPDCDICIYGGTAAGLTAAIAAARRGKRVVVVEPSRWLGGMVGGGIRLMTDCEYPRDVGGITRDMLLTELTFKVFDPDKGQRQLRKLWQSLVNRHNVEVLFEHRLASVAKTGRQIEAITLDYAPPLADGVPAPHAQQANARTIAARIFIDASYEGDLLA